MCRVSIRSFNMPAGPARRRTSSKTRSRLLPPRAFGRIFPFEVHGVEGIRQILLHHLVMFHGEWTEDQVVRAEFRPDLIGDSVGSLALQKLVAELLQMRVQGGIVSRLLPVASKHHDGLEVLLLFR